MSLRRELKAEERALFETAMKDAVRSVKPAAPKPKTAPARTRPISKVLSGSANTAPPALGKPGGLDGNTAARLKRGVLEPEAHLDLHGLTERAAHRVLAGFLHDAALRGVRLVLVVTGKGGRPVASDEPFDFERDGRRGVLKTMVPRWLAEPELSRFVADVRGAHRRHGGEGALYVYLRKPERRR